MRHITVEMRKMTSGSDPIGCVTAPLGCLTPPLECVLRIPAWHAMVCAACRRGPEDRMWGCNIIARLAQSAERKALNLVVVGSSPTVGVLFECPSHTTFTVPPTPL